MNFFSINKRLITLTDDKEEKSEKQLFQQVFFKNNPIPMIAFRLRDLRIVMVNDAAIKKYGYSNEEFLKLTFPDLHENSPEEKEKVNEHFMNMLTNDDSNHSPNIHWLHTLKNGKTINVDIVGQGFESQGIRYRLATIFEITREYESQKVITKLSRTNQVLSHVNKLIAHKPTKTQLLNDVVKLCQSIGKFDLTWYAELTKDNTKLVVITGTGCVADKIINTIHPFEEYVKRCTPCTLAIVQNKPIIINNLSALDTHVVGIDLLVNNNIKSMATIPITLFGKQYGVMGFFSKHIGYFDEEEIDLLEDMCNDISYALESIEKDREIEVANKGLVVSEKKYMSFFENNIAANFLCAVNGDIIDCNQQFLAIFGFKSKDEATSSSIIPFYSKTNNRNEYLRIIKESGKLETLEQEYFRRDGTTIYCLLNIVGIFEDNQLIQNQCFIMDITKIKEAEQEIIKAHELAEQSNNLKDIFLANISHEIRTPLNAIVGFSGIIRDSLEGQLDQEMIDSFDIIEESSSRLTRTVDLIITISKLQSKLVKLNLKDINFDSILNNLITNAVHTLKKKDVNIHYLNNTNISTIESDSSCFTEIFTNLLDNAVKYTQKGTVAIICTILPNGDLSIQVRDTGIGMTKEYMSNLFRPFTQEDTKFSRDYEGTGLGLSVVKHFADLIGYTIKVESVKDEGSCFTVIIPKDNQKN